ncbi:MAG: hypothetical protein FWG75_10330 [Cystobacterineae bacterium]|nr:hypothetical protein [Cystobacterineae bacterium]
MGIQHHAKAPTSLFWPMATAFGALWGAVEITLGSFLHMLKIPFGGAILASLGAALLIAQRQVLPQRGLSMVTALIAALCKSLSPGGVILGPMIGITMEGLLVELALLVSSRFIGCAILAGMLAAMWTVFHKLLSSFVFYGMTLIELYVAVLQKAGQWLGHEGAGWWMALLFVGIISSIGAIGGIFGWRVGQDAARSLEIPP